MLSAAEQSFLLRLARIIVGGYGLAMHFERAGLGIAVTTGSWYGTTVTRSILVEGDGYLALTAPGRNPMTPADLAWAMRDTLRRRTFA